MGSIDKHKLKGIYAITDTFLTPYSNIEDFLIPAFNGGVKILQLRDKNLSDDELLKYALQIQSLCKKHNVLFIVNDRYGLAKEIQADGIHLGSQDISESKMKEARRDFDGVIGISCYGDINRAKTFQGLGADYLAFGSCFASPTKANAVKISLDILEKAKTILQVPVCAIGGINTSNIDEIKKTNVDMIAVISDIWNSDCIYTKVKQLNFLE